MNLLTIGHNFVLAENQKHLEYLAKTKQFSKLALISPEWWVENTQRIICKKSSTVNFDHFTGKTMFTLNNSLFVFRSTVLKQILKFKPDIIEVWEEPWSLSLLQIILIKKIFRLKVKISCYSAQNIDKKFPFPFNLIQEFNLKNVSGVHVCSDSVYQVFKKKYRGTTKIIGLGLDFSDYKYQERAHQDILKLGYVGRIVESKGVFDLIESVSQISNCTLTLCGSGSDETLLRKKIENLGIRDRVIFKGSLNKVDLIKEYHKMDVLVVPSKTTKSWKEQFGRIIVEAYATGLVVIGSDSGSIPEVIGDYGLVCPEGSVDELTLCIQSIMNNREKWQKSRLEASEWVKGLFSWESVASQFESFYRGLSS